LRPLSHRPLPLPPWAGPRPPPPSPTARRQRYYAALRTEKALLLRLAAEDRECAFAAKQAAASSPASPRGRGGLGNGSPGGPGGGGGSRAASPRGWGWEDDVAAAGGGDRT
jgi:hypothetical protein